MRKIVRDHQRDLIESLVSARRNVIDAALAFPAERRDNPCIGIWSVKDLLAHLAGWDYTNIQAIQEILSGKRPSFLQHYDKDWQSYNAQLVRAYRKEPFEALLADVAEAHQQFVSYLQSLPPEEVLHGKSPKELGRPVTISNLIKAETHDEQVHAMQLQAYLQQVLPAQEM